jgi:DNA polymerase-1
MNETKKRLLLVDTPSYYYRAFHALPEFRSPSGEPTGAILGVVNMLRKLKQDFPSDYIACVFDPPGRTFRDEIYPEYKATRQAMPEELSSQIGPLRETIAALGWPVVEVQGVEADDVIGTLAAHARERGLETVISTGDKDLTQLVNERVTWVNTMSGDKLDPEGVKGKFGVRPDRIVDYLTLVGDAVDNVPGVDKVGPKTAAKLIEQFGSLDGVIEHAGDLKGVVGENLRRVTDWLPTARTLVTVKTDVELGFDFDQLLDKGPDNGKLGELYGRFGFRTLRDSVTNREDAAEGADAEPMPREKAGGGRREAGGRQFARIAAGFMPEMPDAQRAAFVDARRYETVTDAEAFERWAMKLEGAPLVCWDTETSSVDPFNAHLVGLAFSVTPGEAAYIPVGHRYPGAPAQLDADAVLRRLGPWLEDAGRLKVGQNGKYDRHVLANRGITVRGVAHDTLLESYVLESHQRHDMDSLAQRHLGAKTLLYEEVAGRGASQIPFDQVDIDRARDYSAEDADVTLQLHGALWPRIEKDAKLRGIYAEIEIPTAHVLFMMERNGVLIDMEQLSAQGHALGQKMLDLERRAHELAGGPFNLGSPKQLCDVLFERLGLKSIKKTPSGAPSVDEEVLEKLAEDHPICRVLLDHRSLSKLKGTYTDKLPKMVNPKTGRVHTTYSQSTAVTGRLASLDPNLQNIPVRTAEGRRIREAFIAPAGSKILSADYSQIELRIMAHLSGDRSLLEAFSRGEDVHRHTASEVFDAAPDQVTSEQRRYAKVINFGLIYGMSAFGLSQNLGIERSAAQAYMAKYFQRYPGVAAYMERTRNEAKERGYVETVFGRRLWLPDIGSANQARRAGAERQAINAPMQGTAADFVKLAMIAVQAWLEKEMLATKLVMQVHDELVLEVPSNELARVKPEVERLMMGVATLDVPLVVEAGVGDNWDEAH